MSARNDSGLMGVHIYSQDNNLFGEINVQLFQMEKRNHEALISIQGRRTGLESLQTPKAVWTSLIVAIASAR